jgi:hypothetical protein
MEGEDDLRCAGRMADIDALNVDLDLDPTLDIDGNVNV